MVRPILEYASELWAGCISKDLEAKLEAVQTRFGRSVLGLTGKRSVSDDFIRAELGLEKIASRCEKLRLGYWRRIHVARGACFLEGRQTPDVASQMGLGIGR